MFKRVNNFQDCRPTCNYTKNRPNFRILGFLDRERERSLERANFCFLFVVFFRSERGTPCMPRAPWENVAWKRWVTTLREDSPAERDKTPERRSVCRVVEVRAGRGEVVSLNRGGMQEERVIQFYKSPDISSIAENRVTPSSFPARWHDYSAIPPVPPRDPGSFALRNFMGERVVSPPPSLSRKCSASPSEEEANY